MNRKTQYIIPAPVNIIILLNKNIIYVYSINNISGLEILDIKISRYNILYT
jgi:hypothetical protein